jgi:molybdate transport repressor ModE-like protein
LLLVPFDLADLDLFTRIAEAGSITHGARRAHLALPSASARVANMERALGTALLERDRRGVTLTPAGTLLLRHARAILEDVERMHADLSRYADGLSATVRVRANTAAMAGFLGDALRGFLADEPRVSLDLQERPSHLIVRALAEGRADIGVLADTVALGDLEHVAVEDDRLVMIAEPGHRIVATAPVSFSQCLDEPFVGLTEGSALWEHLEGRAHPLGQRPRYRIRLPSIELVCRYVAAGVGVSVLPERAVGRWAAEFPVAMVELRDDWAHRRLMICHNRHANLSAPARRLLARLVGSDPPTSAG